ncbi:phospholipase D-like domain-containing protein [Polyangium jinanense]|uniref:Phosphatidylserine/phosphatidylglycerophosphate/ cardiolipin synthase family protein n=1 Tax=Polyangium jinanense TaxID=2829994 RepID=A0A9X4AUE9_9BACT|nr:phosphatidylserine/phosphatidylglycerophosphate/cardiolipin synthase family protein [Polyangium jinanense]MDC3955823.1 phosphatidylserine/phosphatidylglycerophosphate/cardiolipin synthase family protein [Polyangium jinanense]MDC3983182.1 phosphatidylserine/phosphatidylglycerophosphate/cardiolipin synthase family protein [Polyangium jinanense]
MPRERATFDVLVTTPHGAPVQGASVRLLGPRGALVAEEFTPGRSRVVLPRRGDYELIVEPGASPFELKPLRTTLFLTPGKCGSSLAAMSGLDGVRSRVERIECAEGRITVHVVLDYVWFSHMGYPPTLGNRVDILVDGEDGWRAVAEALLEARRTIRVTTWVYEPELELLRPDPLAEPADREAYTIQRILESRAQASVTVQLLLWDPPLLPIPGEARRVALTEGDGFEVLTEKNPTERPIFDERHSLGNFLFGDVQIGSFHQKTVVVDGRIGFCGGMNMRQNDWDTRHHRLFEPGRCRFSRPGSFRARVKEGLCAADHPPRHDFVARIEGPSVAHLEENFRERWNRLLERGAPNAERSTPVPPPEPAVLPEAPGRAVVQVVRTMPAPHTERGILDVYLRAVAAARRLIYVEDQYFRSTYVSEAIVEAARKNPRLAVLVITSEAQANHPLTGAWSHACFERIREAIPDFELYSLRCAGRDGRGKRRVQEVDHHGKLLLVDDVFVMVGSCNVNDRGFEYEGECNVAIVDPAFAATFRLGLFRDYLGGDPRLGKDIERDVAIFREHAARHAERPPDGDPHPYVVPFAPRPRRSQIFGRSVF